MLDKFFEELSQKGLVKKTKYCFMVDNAGNYIYKSMQKGVKSIILNTLKEQGFSVEYNKENKLSLIFYKNNFAGALQ